MLFKYKIIIAALAKLVTPIMDPPSLPNRFSSSVLEQQYELQLLVPILNTVTDTTIIFCLPDVDDPSQRIFADLQAAAASPERAAQITSVLVITNHDPNEERDSYKRGESRSNVLTRRMREALQLLGKFSGLEKIHIHFARYSKAPRLASVVAEYDDEDDYEIEEMMEDRAAGPSDSVQYRSVVLRTVFDMLAGARIHAHAYESPKL
jgi:hypothetical protein